jgi:glycosyltransferase involved in cell wall biosynthesis
MKMCDAFTKLGNNTTLHAKRPKYSKETTMADFSNIYGVTTNFKVISHSSHRYIRHLDYDATVLISVLKSKPDLIYTRSLRGAFLANFFKKDVILELHFLPTTGPSAWILKQLASGTYLKKIIVISEKLKTLVLSEHPYLSSVPIEVCHDAVDIDRFSVSNINSTEQKNELNIDIQKKIVMYVGHLYEGRGINLIERLAKSLPDMNFIVIGGLEKDVLYRKHRLSKLQITNLYYYGFIPNANLHTYYQIADILIMPYEKKVSVSGGGDTSEWMSPMKTYEYMATGKPIISSDLPALREVLNESNAILVEPDNVEDWKYHIENTLTNTILATKISFNARMCAESNTWNDRVSKILGHL